MSPLEATTVRRDARTSSGHLPLHGPVENCDLGPMRPARPGDMVLSMGQNGLDMTNTEGYRTTRIRMIRWMFGVVLCVALIFCPMRVVFTPGNGLDLVPAVAIAKKGSGKGGSGGGNSGSGSSGSGGHSGSDDDDDDDDSDDDDDDDDDDDSSGSGGHSGSGSGGSGNSSSGGGSDDRGADDDDGASSSDGAGKSQTAPSNAGATVPGTNLAITKVVVGRNGVQVWYSDGSSERIRNGRYEWRNGAGRSVSKRQATGTDLARLRGLAAGVNITSVKSSREAGATSVKVEISGQNIAVKYSNGWRESIRGGIYELRDPYNRSVAKRAGTAADVKRMKAAAN